ncbi:hypothetical protein DFJ77DRAFT_6102 [Powellomyces hirtus]|nr:hypothetical protein DFJ77DRAFT_6102 [Powellomyces hirtus]
MLGEAQAWPTIVKQEIAVSAEPYPWNLPRGEPAQSIGDQEALVPKDNRSPQGLDTQPTATETRAPEIPGANRRQWDQAYERTRKTQKKRGHGTNLDPEQQARFPPSSATSTYANFIEGLLTVLRNLRDTMGYTEFTRDAVNHAKNQVAGYKAKGPGRGPWRVWLPEHVWDMFQVFKASTVCGTVTQAEFVELLLNLNGREKEGNHRGVQHHMLRAPNRAAQVKILKLVL